MENKRKPKVYFACSIMGGREFQPIYPVIVKTLEENGIEVLSKEFAESDLTEEGHNELSPKEIHDRDMAWIDEADFVVAEASVISMGLGYELGRLAERDDNYPYSTPVFIFVKEGRKLSAMIAGNEKNFNISYYRSEDDLKNRLFDVCKWYKNKYFKLKI